MCKGDIIMIRLLSFIVALSVLSSSALAETARERFARMDLNKDGFLSEREFLAGTDELPETSAPAEKSAEPVSVSADEKNQIIEKNVAEAKTILPLKIDEETTWTDVYGKNGEIHYLYRVEMDISAVPDDKKAFLKPVLEAKICPTVRPVLCGVVYDSILSKGIALQAHYNDKNGISLAECRFEAKDCR